MNINGKWYSEPELAAYVKELEEKLHDRDLEADNGARQIAHYEDELRQAKKLLKAAVEDIRHCMHYYDPCEVCSLLDKDGECPTTDDDDCKEKYKWCYEDEALALIEGGRDVFAIDTSVGGKGGADNDT